MPVTGLWYRPPSTKSRSHPRIPDELNKGGAVILPGGVPALGAPLQQQGTFPFTGETARKGAFDFDPPFGLREPPGRR